MKTFLRCKGSRKQPTYNLTHKGYVDLIDAPSKNSKCQSSVEEEVNECVPAISADADHTANNEHRVTNTFRHILFNSNLLDTNLSDSARKTQQSRQQLFYLLFYNSGEPMHIVASISCSLLAGVVFCYCSKSA